MYKECRDMYGAEVNIRMVAPDTAEDEYTAAFVRKCTRMQQSESKLDKYLKDPCPLPTCDILLWWQNHGVIYPVLSHIVRDYLVIQASSIPSERAFSSCGHLITPKRSCLHHDTVCKSMFGKHCIHSVTINLNFCQIVN
jgi:hypothetical protein